APIVKAGDFKKAAHNGRAVRLEPEWQARPLRGEATFGAQDDLSAFATAANPLADDAFGGPLGLRGGRHGIHLGHVHQIYAVVFFCVTIFPIVGRRTPIRSGDLAWMAQTSGS